MLGRLLLATTLSAGAGEELPVLTTGERLDLAFPAHPVPDTRTVWRGEAPLEFRLARPLRGILAAEDTYARMNGGFPDTPECLRGPQRCVPGGAASPLLDQTVVFDVARSGYVIRFFPGRPAVPADPGAVSPSSLQGYAVTAVPERQNHTGVRAFCADFSGRICVMADDDRGIDEAWCPTSCKDL